MKRDFLAGWMELMSGKRQIIVIPILFVVAGCSDHERQPVTKQETDVASQPALKTYGTLRAMFHEGKTSEVVNLKSLLPDPDLYAVGALSELRGEITIVGGKVYLSYPEGTGDVRSEVAKVSTEGAALLVAADVSDWRSVETRKPINFRDLDERLAELAASVGLDADQPFVFLVRGQFSSVRWHIIDGSRLEGSGSSHEDHLKASVRREAHDVRGLLVGFYSQGHHGVFTHMGSNTHVHWVTEQPLSSGHVDDVVIPEGVTVRFSANLRGAP